MNVRSLAVAAILMASLAVAYAQDKVVYHVNDAASQALSALRYISNQLDTDPATQITLVAHAGGVDFLVEGAKDRNGSLYDLDVSELASRGVKFEVCEITLKARKMTKDQFIQEANFTPSGVVRLTKLQLAGYAYIKP